MRTSGFFLLLLSFSQVAWGQSLPALDAPVCGDGVVQTGEACDDGNTESGDGCRRDCLKVEVCGDGVQDVGEVCDDGNTKSGDGCSASCFPDTERSICGDGIVTHEEACDDGNAESGDGCSSFCQKELTFVPKQSGTAFALPLLFTTMGAGLLFIAGECINVCVPGGLAGIFVGPSVGHIYTGEIKHVARFTLYRLLAAGVVVGGLSIIFRDLDFAPLAAEGLNVAPPLAIVPKGAEVDDILGGAIAVTGLAAYTALVFYDIVDAHFSAMRVNSRLLHDNEPRLSLTPAPLVTPSGLAPGLVLGGRF